MLRLYSGVLAGQAFVSDISRVAQKWRRSIRMQGGYWLGTFELAGQSAAIQHWFYNYLGYHLEERTSGAMTWEGMVYEMDLTVNGVTRRRSLDDVWNAVNVAYIDATSSATVETGFLLNNDSVGRYGRKELRVTMDDVTPELAMAERETRLQTNAFARTRPVGQLDAKRADGLKVTVCGYVFTSNWRYTSVKDGVTGDVSGWVRDIINTDCEFLGVGTVEQNGVQVLRDLQVVQRAWDTMKPLADSGDSAGSLWRLGVGRGRRVDYTHAEMSPKYFLRDGTLYDSYGGSRVATNPFAVQPGVVRDMDYPVQRRERGTVLLDARDILVDEVMASEDGIRLKFLAE